MKEYTTPIAVFAESAFSGIEILEIIQEHFDEYVIARYFYSEQKQPEKAHKLKICYNKNGQPYFRFMQRRYKIDDFIRT